MQYIYGVKNIADLPEKVKIFFKEKDNIYFMVICLMLLEAQGYTRKQK